VLARIFEPKWYEVTGEWRKLNNVVLKDVFCSPYIVWVIKSRRMKWAVHEALTGERRGVYRVSVGKLEGTQA
jgi:hypothetical protein